MWLLEVEALGGERDGKRMQKKVSPCDFVTIQGYFLNLAKNERNVYVATIAMMFSV